MDAGTLWPVAPRPLQTLCLACGPVTGGTAPWPPQHVTAAAATSPADSRQLRRRHHHDQMPGQKRIAASSAECRCSRDPLMRPRATLGTLFCGHERDGGPSASRRRTPAPGALRPTQRTSSPKPKRESSSKATGRRKQGGQRRPRASARPSVIRHDERCPSKSQAGKSKRLDRARAASLSTGLTRSFLRRGAVSLPVAVCASSARKE